MRRFLVLLTVLGLLAAGAGDAAAQARTKIRYALGDVVSIDELQIERLERTAPRARPPGLRRRRQELRHDT